MLYFGLFLFSLLMQPLLAQTREYRSPVDSEGFSPAVPVPTQPEPAASERPRLQVLALNKKGFLHQSRRHAEGLGEEPFLLEEAGRIYSPSQSFVALLEDKHALIILHPQTSLHAEPLPDRWRYVLSGDRGMIRLSTQSHSLALLLQSTDSQSPWHDHRLQLNPGSDLYLKYERNRLVLYVLRGHVSYFIQPLVPLLSKRNSGLLFDWEQKQIRRAPKAPYEIEVFAGQELTLEPGLYYQIGLPNAEVWQAPVLRTSPQLAEKTDTENKLANALGELRTRWLNSWKDETPLEKLLQERRYEEAYERIKDLPPSDTRTGWEIFCLFRLQQETHAEKKRLAVPNASSFAALLHEESLRTRLRRRAWREVKAPRDLRHSTLTTEEIYLLAGSEQSQGRWRSALDLWERWPNSVTDADLLLSYKEWQRHLDQRKPWSWWGSAELGWSDNVLHLPSGTAAPPEIGHRSSWFLSSQQKLAYLLERSDDFSVNLESRLDLKIFQHSSLIDLQAVEAGLGLPLMIQLPLEQQSLQLRPFVARLLRGSSLGLDRFGYQLSWQIPIKTFQPIFSWAQEQNLDFQPTLDHRLDALSGEAVGAIDRSVRRNTLSVRSGLYEVLWQAWDYRYAGSQKDDRQRLQVSGAYGHDFPYDLGLLAEGSFYQDIFARERSSVSAIRAAVELRWQNWLRLEPYAALSREMRSGEAAASFNETQWVIGIHDRW